MFEQAKHHYNALFQAAQHRRNHSDGGIQHGEETSLAFEAEKSSPQKNGNEVLHFDDDVAYAETRAPPAGSTSVYQFYESRMASLIRKNGMLEGQLAAALANQVAAENNLSSVMKNKQEMEKKLGDAVKEVELLKEKLAGIELVQEEANSLSNIVHSDNVRLEHDVAFLKAVLDDTQKVRWTLLSNLMKFI